MKYIFFIIMIVMGLSNNIQILSSSKSDKDNKNLFNNIFTDNKKRTQEELDNDGEDKVSKIADFLKNGLTFCQAHDAYQKKLNTEDAIQAAFNNELKTIELINKKVKASGNPDADWFIESNCHEEKRNTQFYTKVASLIKLGLSFCKSCYAYQQNLTDNQAIRILQKLQTNNFINNSKITKQIKEEAAAATKISATVRGWKTRDNLKTGK